MHTLNRKLSSLALRLNYWFGNYRDTLWLIGDGRSGTTWVSSLINFDSYYREMFEPFHPTMVREMDFLLPHQYVRPDEKNERLEKISRQIFNGSFTNPRVDNKSRPRVYKGLLIKDIFASLFARWASDLFPEVKIVLLIRHPYSVALSKAKKLGKKWYWGLDLKALLEQRTLFDDYLHPFNEIIQKTSKEDDPFQKLVLLWAVNNYVPLRQFKKEQIHILFYEDVFLNPQKEISEVLTYAGRTAPNLNTDLFDKAFITPSRVSGNDSNIIKGSSPIDPWKHELSSKQIMEGEKILEYFGLHELYNEDGLPDQKAIKSFQLI